MNNNNKNTKKYVHNMSQVTGSLLEKYAHGKTVVERL